MKFVEGFRFSAVQRTVNLFAGRPQNWRYTLPRAQPNLPKMIVLNFSLSYDIKTIFMLLVGILIVLFLRCT